MASLLEQVLRRNNNPVAADQVAQIMPSLVNNTMQMVQNTAGTPVQVDNTPQQVQPFGLSEFMALQSRTQAPEQAMPDYASWAMKGGNNPGGSSNDKAVEVDAFDAETVPYMRQAMLMTTQQLGEAPSLGIFATAQDRADLALWWSQARQNAAHLQQMSSEEAMREAILATDLTDQQRKLIAAGYGKEVAGQLIENGKLPSDAKLASVLFKPGSPEWREFIKTMNTPKGTSVVTNNYLESGAEKFSEQQGKALDAELDEFAALSDGVQTRLDKWNQLAQLYEHLDRNPNNNVRNGSMDITEAMRSFGWDFDWTGDFVTGQEIRAYTNEMIKQELDRSAGAQTDSDREFVATILPNLDTDPYARNSLISFRRSREYLNNYYGNRASAIRWDSDSYESTRDGYKKLREEYSNMPAAVTIDGKPLFFDRVLQMNGYDYEVAISEWRKIVEEER